MKKIKWILLIVLLFCLCSGVYADRDHEGCFIKKKSEFMRFFNSVVSEYFTEKEDSLKNAVNNLRFFSDITDALVLSDNNTVKASMNSKRIKVDDVVVKAIAQAKKKRGVVVLRKKQKGDLRHYIFISPIFRNSGDYQGCSLVEYAVNPCGH